MSNSTKCIISFAIGGIIGAAISFLLTKHICEKQCSEVIEGIREFYEKESKEEKKIKEIEEDYTEFVRKTAKEYVPPAWTDYNKIVPGSIYSDPTCQSVNGSELGVEDGEEYPEDFEDDGGTLHPEELEKEKLKIEPIHKDVGDDPEPYIIAEEEYFAEDGICQRDCLTYYEGDGVIADDMDDPVDPELIGVDNIALLEERDVIYVKNFECGMKWEICKAKGSFNDLMLGEMEGPGEN